MNFYNSSCQKKISELEAFKNKVNKQIDHFEKGQEKFGAIRENLAMGKKVKLKFSNFISLKRKGLDNNTGYLRFVKQRKLKTIDESLDLSSINEVSLTYSISYVYDESFEDNLFPNKNEPKEKNNTYIFFYF